jgi:hypothetical protein
MVDIAAINLSNKTAVLDDGVTVLIDQMFDQDGEETDDPDLAVSAVVPLPDGRWAVVLLDEYEGVSLQ